jgi:hypothetical protein
VSDGQQHDENQIYGCLMVPVDLLRRRAPEADPMLRVERWAATQIGSRRSSSRWASGRGKESARSWRASSFGVPVAFTDVGDHRRDGDEEQDLRVSYGAISPKKRRA